MPPPLPLPTLLEIPRSPPKRKKNGSSRGARVNGEARRPCAANGEATLRAAFFSGASSRLPPGFPATQQFAEGFFSALKSSLEVNNQHNSATQMLDGVETVCKQFIPLWPPPHRRAGILAGTSSQGFRRRTGCRSLLIEPKGLVAGVSSRAATAAVEEHALSVAEKVKKVERGEE